MRNKTTTIILISAIILLVIFMFIGIKIGGFQVLSIFQLKQKNNDLNKKISEAGSLTSIEYPNKIDTLTDTYEQYRIQKSKYEEISGFTTDNNDTQVYETKQYDIEYLWKVLGKYATSNNLKLGIDVQKSNAQTSLYNLNFTVSGAYVNISEFIVDIENDSDLNFRIYNFKMNGNGENVTSTFMVKDVNIDSSIITTSKVTNTNQTINSNENNQTINDNNNNIQN